MEKSPTTRISWYFILGLLLLIIGFVMGLLFLPFLISGDANPRFIFMDTLVHELKLTPMRYSMVGPLFSLPLWWVYGYFNDPSGVIARYNFLLFAIFLVITFLWMRKHFDQKFLLSFLLVLAFGSMFPAHLLNYYGEVFSAVCLGLGTLGLVTRKTWLGWVLLVLAVINIPVLFVPFALVVLYSAWERKQYRFLLLLPLCVLLVLAEGYLRNGSLLAEIKSYLFADHGFHTVLPFSGRSGFSYPFVLGVLSILLSFGKGLVFFCPGLLLAGWAWKLIATPLERRLVAMWLLIVLGLVMVYASWWSWYGGWYWGPRFFLFASLPASWFVAKTLHAPQKSLLRVVLLMIIVTVSIWVGVNGVVFGQKTLDVCGENNYALEFMCWYVPEFSPLIRPFITHLPFQWRDILFLGLFGAAWLYLMVPLGRDFIQALRGTLQSHRPLLDLSNWKFISLRDPAWPAGIVRSAQRNHN